MKIEIITDNGKRSRITVKDANATVFLARLNGPNKWVDINEDGKTFVNFDHIVIIEVIEETPPE